LLLGAACLQVGDLLAIRNADGKYYTSLVTRISRSFEAGAYSPQLTDGGMLVIDDVASLPFGAATVVSLTNNQPFFYVHYRATPIWQLYLASAGCGGTTECPCMDDAPTSPSTPLGCLRRNQALRERGTAIGWWHTEISKVSAAATAAGWRAGDCSPPCTCQLAAGDTPVGPHGLDDSNQRQGV
jgi:hypothetical protein